MKTIVVLMFVFMLMIVAAPAHSAEVVQINPFKVVLL